MRLQIQRLTKGERDHYLERGGINGSELDECRAPLGEFLRNVEILLDNLASFGTSSLDVDSPFYVDRFAEPDYFPCIEVADCKILSPMLIQIVHQCVLTMGPPYRIDVCNARPLLEEYQFNIFVECKVVYVYSDKDQLIEILGLSGPQFTY